MVAENKSKLGANSILSVSIAVAKAAAASSALPLFLYLREFIKKDAPSETRLKIPIPMFALMNGGKDYPGRLDFKEVLMISASSKQFNESLQMGFLAYRSLKRTLQIKNAIALITESGGFSPNISKNEDALLVLKEALTQTTIRLGFDAFLGLDADASCFIRTTLIVLRARPSRCRQKIWFHIMQNLIKRFTFCILRIRLPRTIGMDGL